MTTIKDNLRVQLTELINIQVRQVYPQHKGRVSIRDTDSIRTEHGVEVSFPTVERGKTIQGVIILEV